MKDQTIFKPEAPVLHRPFTIREVHTLNYRTKTFVFDQPLDCHPGQFVMAWLPRVDEKPFSIAGADPLTLTVVAVGAFSEALHRLQPGEQVWIRGPFGNGFRLEGQHALLAGGGYGVAPLFFLARQALSQGMTVSACIGARTKTDVLLAQELRDAGVDVSVATEDGSLGEQGLITRTLEKQIDKKRPDGVYACGPVKMLEAIDRQCGGLGVMRQLSWEAHMRCGMGLCGSCELESESEAHECTCGHGPGWLVCLDGPVSYEKGS